MSSVEQSTAAEMLAHCLRTIHALKPNEALCALLPREGLKHEFEEILRVAETAVLPQLSTHEAASVCSGALQYIDAPSNFAFTPTLIHADLHHEHLLTQQGLMTGVIDFDTAALSDPDHDFSDFLEEMGEAFIRICAHRHGQG